MRLGIIARADATGLGVQSRNWVRLLKPYKVIVIDSRPFNKNEQHFEWYENENAFKVSGFIQNNQTRAVLSDIDVLLTFEIPYSYELLRVAKSMGVKTIIQNNWEFTDYLQNQHLPLPDLLVNHSYWHLDDQKKRWPDITDYCPTPVFIEDFEEIMMQNMDRSGKRRFLHIAGRKTYEDRNGTESLIEAIKLIPKHIHDFELVIKTQSTEVGEIDDDRVVIDRNPPEDEKELYRDFDAMIMPRRYAGACLPMNEALAAGLPVIMTDIDPNNKVLPKEWLVPATKKSQFMARTMIEVFAADPQALANKIIQFNNFTDADIRGAKIEARNIAVKEYSSQSVLEKWAGLLQKIGV